MMENETIATGQPVLNNPLAQPLSDENNLPRHSQVYIREKRREDRLRRMKERQFDEPTLHQLFRLFDRDNDHILSLSDFQTGLVAMGYSDAKDTSVVARIVSEIDTDRSGNIREDEFVEYFVRRRLDDLEKRLHEVAKEDTPTLVRVIEYGVLDREYLDSGFLHMSRDDDITSFRFLLKGSAPSTLNWSVSPRRWFDMNGYHQDSMLLFSQCFGIHEETMKDAGIYQKQKMEVLTPGPAAVREGMPSPITCSRSATHRIPSDHVETTEGKNKEGGGDVVDIADLKGCDLEDFANAGPAPPCARTETDRSKPEDTDCSDSVQSLPVPVAQNKSPLIPIPDKAERNGSVRSLPIPPPRSLTEHEQHNDPAHAIIIIHALDCSPPLSECVWGGEAHGAQSSKRLTPSPDPTLVITQFTVFSVHDDVVLTVRKTFAPLDDDGCEQESTPSDMWDDLRERIRCADADMRVNSGSAKYLAFSAVEVIMEHNYKLRDSLRKWIQDLEEAVQRNAETHHTVHLYEFSKLATSYLAELRAVADSLESVCGKRSSDNSKKSTSAASLALYFNNEHIFFKDLADEVDTISVEVEEMLSTARGLGEYYRAVQEDRMNRTLYILTLVTSVFVPAQFLTGLYGMNFEVMPELTWRYSYYVFWGVVLLSTGLVALWLRYSFLWGLRSGIGGSIS